MTYEEALAAMTHRCRMDYGHKFNPATGYCDKRKAKKRDNPMFAQYSSLWMCEGCPGPVPLDCTREEFEELKPTSVPVSRRARRVSGVDPDVFGSPEIATCGATPDQMVRLRVHSKDPQTREFMIQWISEVTGYKELSYLTADEAARLLNILGTAREGGNGNKTDASTIDPSASQEAENRIPCPVSGEPTFESFCMTQCQDRAQAGFCPAVDREMPVGGLI